jgi:hypothetical protein
MPKVTTIAVLHAVDEDFFILTRYDFPRVEDLFIWCGAGTGWRPWNTTTEILAKTFRSTEEAQQAACKIATLPLQE